MALKAKENAQGQIASEFVIPKLVRRMAKLLPCSHILEPSPRLVLEEGEGSRAISYIPLPSARGWRRKGLISQGGRAGAQAPTFMWTVFGQKGYEQGNETSPWILGLFLCRRLSSF